MDNMDVILPDDFTTTETATPTADDATAEVQTDTPSAETKQDTQEPQQTEPTTLKIKYNHEEKEISLDEARELSQKGLNYEKAIEKARDEARQSAIDQYIANQGYVWNGKPINTQAEYERALYENSLIEQGYDIEQINAGVEEHPEVKKAREQNAKTIEEDRLQQEVNEFNKEYPGEDIEKLDKQILEYRMNTGKSLTDSMRWFENKQLKERITILEQNAKNAQSAPVSGVTAHGADNPATDNDDFLKGFNSI